MLWMLLIRTKLNSVEKELAGYEQLSRYLV